ncbi:MAG: efflux RND transporter permease subunit [Planctomycetes bacterium]|nr:efflux RND transporter permease subunit [Planctomycetota bacterium]
MRGLADVCIQRPVFATMLVLALVVAGAVGFHFLAVDRYPAYDLPNVTVRTELPGGAPEEVEVSVTYPIEEAVNSVEGIRELRSISGSGTSLVFVTFELGRDIETAAQDVRDRVAQVVRRLPEGVEPPVISKFDSDSGASLTLALAGDRPLRELTEIADKRIKRVLERSSGVGEVRIVGGLQRTINVWVDADRLAAYGLPVSTVSSAIRAQNVDQPGGNVTDHKRERTLRTMGRVLDPDAFVDLTIARRNGVPIHLGDVAEIEDGTEEPRSLARLDGVPTVVLEIRRQSGANTVAVIDGVRASLARLQAQLPPDLRLEVVRDQSRYIRAALHEIEFHLVVGSVLAALVVLWFLRSWRATLIAGIAIPVSVVATFGVMWALGFTLNGVTMLALVLMVGVVIDDAIVVLENVQRWADEKGVGRFEAARGAVAEIALAVLATTLSLVVIFVPVSFLGSITGRFLYQFGITAAVAVLMSLLVSFTLTPAMCARLVVPARGAGHGGVRRTWSERVYLAVLRWCLRRPWTVVLVSALVCATPLAMTMRQDFIPSDVDEGEFEIDVNGPDDVSLPAMDEVMARIEAELRQMPQVRTALTQVGGGFLSGLSNGSVYVRIPPHEKRRFSFGRLWSSLLAGDPLAAFRGNYTQREVMTEIERRLRGLPDVRVSVRNQRSMNLGGGPFPLDFAIRGPDLRTLADAIEQLRVEANKLGTMAGLNTTLRLRRPELRAIVDRPRAAELGVQTQDIGGALRLLVGGATEVSRFRDPKLDEEYDVRLRLREQDRDRAERLGDLLVGRVGGDTVRLDNLVRIESTITSSRIDRMDRQRQANLRGSPGAGQALADCVAQLRSLAGTLQLPAEYTTAVSGSARELERFFGEYLFALLLAVVFMYMILAAQFESLTQPLIILLAIPVSAPFALLALLVTGETLNLYSALGILVLFGMVKKNAILQVDHTNHLLAAGMAPYDAVLQGSRDRLRPILMTTFAFVAGMLPLAIGSGPGAEERKAIAIVVIGGQTLCLGLSLVLTPVAQLLVLRAGERWRTRRAGVGSAAEPATQRG